MNNISEHTFQLLSMNKELSKKIEVVKQIWVQTANIYYN